MALNDQQRDILARTIMGEAANQGWEGQAAVAHTIRNRTSDPRWPNDPAAVAKQPKQFSAWNSGVGGNDLVNVDPTSEGYLSAARVADEVFGGQVPDMTGGATHYYSPIGMQAHVARGEQSNLEPRWLQEETARRENGALTIGDHIFTGAAQGAPSDPHAPITTTGLGYAPVQNASGQPMYSSDGNVIPQAAENDGVQGGGREPIKNVKDPHDMSWYDPVTGQSGQPQEINQPAFEDIGEPVGPVSNGPYGPGGPVNTQNSPVQAPQGGLQDRVSAQSAPALETPETGFFDSLFGERTPDWLKGDKSRELLAIGTGLLSGSNWQEGFANSAQGLQGIAENNIGHERDMELAQTNRQHDLDLVERRAALSAADTPNRQYLSNVKMKDGTTRADLSFDPSTGRVVDSQGNDVSDQVEARVNNSTAAGSKGEMSVKDAAKYRTGLESNRDALETMDRVYSSVADQEYGISGAVNELEIFWKTLTEQGLTEEEIRKKATQGELQGLIGATKDKVVGGGVMTEQDALRIIEALGGDMKSLRSNPELLRRQLSIQRDKLFRSYQAQADQYDAFVDKYGDTIPYVPHERYIPAEGLYDDQPEPVITNRPALDSSNAPKVPDNFPGDPADWEFMTPEERKLFE